MFLKGLQKTKYFFFLRDTNCRNSLVMFSERNKDIKRTIVPKPLRRIGQCAYQLGCLKHLKKHKLIILSAGEDPEQLLGCRGGRPPPRARGGFLQTRACHPMDNTTARYKDTWKHDCTKTYLLSTAALFMIDPNWSLPTVRQPVGKEPTGHLLHGVLLGSENT